MLYEIEKNFVSGLYEVVCNAMEGFRQVVFQAETFEEAHKKMRTLYL